jgi:hypothetical protein
MMAVIYHKPHYWSGKVKRDSQSQRARNDPEAQLFDPFSITILPLILDAGLL